MILILLLFISLWFPVEAKASSLSILCNDAGCLQNGSDWNLSASGILPGWMETENFNIKNTRKEDCLIRMAVAPEGEFLPLGGKVMMSIKENSDIIWAGHLSDLLNNPTPMEMVGAKNSNDWVMALSLDQDSNETVQNKTAHFGFDVNFTCQPVERVKDPEEGIIINEYFPYPAVGGKEWVEIKNINSYPADLSSWKIYDSGDNKTNVNLSMEPGEIKFIENSSQFFNNDSADMARLFSNKGKQMDWSSYTKATQGLSFSRQADGTFCLTDPSQGGENNVCKTESNQGNVLGATVQVSQPINGTPVCQTQKPVGRPINLTATAGSNSVTLRWTEGEGPLNYYLVAYGDDSAAEDYGNPNIGGNGTRSYTINGLQLGKTYYFKVRSGNGCSPGDFSEVVSATPQGVLLSQETVPTGFQGGVLGESTEKTTPTLIPDNDKADTKGEVMGIKTAEIFKPWMIWVIIGLIALRLLLEVVKPKRG